MFSTEHGAVGDVQVVPPATAATAVVRLGAAPDATETVLPCTVMAAPDASGFDQYPRLTCMLAARLSASSAASERRAAIDVLENAAPCSLAMPSRPTPRTTSATRTSTRLNP